MYAAMAIGPFEVRTTHAEPALCEHFWRQNNSCPTSFIKDAPFSLSIGHGTVSPSVEIYSQYAQE